MYNKHMYFLSLASIFVLGTLIGSFINVIALRYNTGLTISSGRSKCFSCGVTLKWYELFPVLSYVFLGGKCKTCKSKISLQYPIIELLTGIVFVSIVLRQISLWPIYQEFPHGLIYSILLSVYYGFVFSLLLVIVVYDIHHKIIPNLLVYIFIALSLVKLLFFMFLKDFSLNKLDIFDLSSPLVLFVPFALLWLFSGGRWMGFGDAKLVFGIGALLGFIYGINAIVLAFWSGAIISIFLMVIDKISGNMGKVNLHSELPFAPYLVLATMVVFFMRLDVLGLGNFLSLFQ
jgi:leader peptidase (prepilin peptidase) / N-methyltransferase